jgi:hypothetical protein
MENRNIKNIKRMKNKCQKTLAHSLMGLAHPARVSKDLCGAGTKGRYKRRIGFPCVFRDSYLSLITVPLLVSTTIMRQFWILNFKPVSDPANVGQWKTTVDFKACAAIHPTSSCAVLNRTAILSWIRHFWFPALALVISRPCTYSARHLALLDSSPSL